ncbi:MAG: PFL family protein [Victivallales bacterium]|nr:PFL family protein [Victivallales bacterium]MBT7163948.1 PFL family protein [Victivallales bacterium]MBT7299836.1 PFL family protein [Victivallales bacterium]
MIRSDQILNTVSMIQNDNLDVRTITMGINLLDCRHNDIDVCCRKIVTKIEKYAGALVDTCEAVSTEFGVPIVNKRIAVSPAADVAAGHPPAGFVAIAKAMDQAARSVKIDFIGGYSAQVQKGASEADRVLIETLPDAMMATQKVCSSINVATSRAGINMNMIGRLGHVLKEMAERSADQDGFACAKLVIFANQPEDNPFMAGAYHGHGEPEVVINVGVSGPGVVASALKRRIARDGAENLGLEDLAEEIKQTSCRVTRCGEIIGREVARRMGIQFGVVDLSLAPTPKVGDSIGEILQILGMDAIGAPGSTACVAMLNDAVKKGGAFASQAVGGLSGAFIPVCEDAVLSAAAESGELTLEKLEAMTCVCSVGLDMVAIPGDTPAETISAMIADEMAIGMINKKTTAVRLIPVPGKKAGEKVVFGGLFGESAIMPVRNAGKSARFINFGGHIPAPIHSLNN